MLNFMKVVKNWVDSLTTYHDWELEKYLAGSTDAADLEHRMRKWEKEMSHRNRFFMN
jgi:hypothetical protein